MNKILIMMITISLVVFGACSSELPDKAEENLGNVEDSMAKFKEKAKDMLEEVSVNETVNTVKEKINNKTLSDVADMASTLINKSPIDIEAQDLTDLGLSEDALDAKIEVDDDGSIVVDKEELGITEDLGEDPGIESWCISGEEFEDENEYGSIVGEIIGISEFKNETYCKSEAVADLGNGVGKIDTTYYYNFGKKDVWVVTEIFGQKIEQHIVSG